MGRTGFSWPRIGSSGRFFECGNEPPVSKKKAGYCLTSRVTISFSKNIVYHEVCTYHI
jgi:hypothetical protein